jgi:hypothetical protein
MTATTMANISYNDTASRLSSYQKFYGKPSLLQMDHLFEFDRLGYVTNRRRIKSKLAPKPIKFFFVAYAFNYSVHIYCMYKHNMLS